MRAGLLRISASNSVIKVLSRMGGEVFQCARASLLVGRALLYYYYNNHATNWSDEELPCAPRLFLDVASLPHLLLRV